MLCLGFGVQVSGLLTSGLARDERRDPVVGSSPQ